MQNELDGKVALVTGGSRGLGAATALKLAQAGALVCINYASNRNAADLTVAQIEAAGGRAFAVQTRLEKFSDAQNLANAVNDELARRTGKPGLDILVNNIGGDGYGSIDSIEEVHYRHVMTLNVDGAFFVTKAFYHHLRDGGRVINISSTGARLTDPDIISYTMAKAAIDAFTRVLAQDLGPRGITVNAVSPGFTAGETNKQVTDDAALSKQVTDATALRRFGTPEEIADTVFMLASPLGRWITAQVVDASGGFKL